MLMKINVRRCRGSLNASSNISSSLTCFAGRLHFLAKKTVHSVRKRLSCCHTWCCARCQYNMPIQATISTQHNNLTSSSLRIVRCTVSDGMSTSESTWLVLASEWSVMHSTDLYDQTNICMCVSLISSSQLAVTCEVWFCHCYLRLAGQFNAKK